MDTDELEHDMNELCREWMSGKAPTDGCRLARTRSAQLICWARRRY
jgi:hypothetical protein